MCIESYKVACREQRAFCVVNKNKGVHAARALGHAPTSALRPAFVLTGGTPLNPRPPFQTFPPCPTRRGTSAPMSGGRLLRLKFVRRPPDTTARRHRAALLPNGAQVVAKCFHRPTPVPGQPHPRDPRDVPTTFFIQISVYLWHNNRSWTCGQRLASYRMTGSDSTPTRHPAQPTGATTP